MAKEFTVEELQEFEPIPHSETTEIRVRLVRFNQDPTPRIDIRQYVTSKGYTGWSKGIALTEDQFKALMGQGLAILGAIPR